MENNPTMYRINFDHPDLKDMSDALLKIRLKTGEDKIIHRVAKECLIHDLNLFYVRCGCLKLQNYYREVRLKEEHLVLNNTTTIDTEIFIKREGSSPIDRSIENDYCTLNTKKIMNEIYGAYGVGRVVYGSLVKIDDRGRLVPIEFLGCMSECNSKYKFLIKTIEQKRLYVWLGTYPLGNNLEHIPITIKDVLLPDNEEMALDINKLNKYHVISLRNSTKLRVLRDLNTYQNLLNFQKEFQNTCRLYRLDDLKMSTYIGGVATPLDINSILKDKYRPKMETENASDIPSRRYQQMSPPKPFSQDNFGGVCSASEIEHHLKFIECSIAFFKVLGSTNPNYSQRDIFLEQEKRLIESIKSVLLDPKVSADALSLIANAAQYCKINEIDLIIECSKKRQEMGLGPILNISVDNNPS
jgi:hypothetical protein